LIVIEFIFARLCRLLPQGRKKPSAKSLLYAEVQPLLANFLCKVSDN